MLRAYLSRDLVTVNIYLTDVVVAKPARSGIGVEVSSVAKLQAQEALNFVPKDHLFSTP
jgi:hypothetical protein